MRIAAVLLLLVVVVALVVPEADAGRRRRRFWRTVGKVARTGFTIYRVIKGRDVNSVDMNKDGYIDEAEAEAFFGNQLDARDVMFFADENNDAKVSLDEFSRGVREAMLRDDGA